MLPGRKLDAILATLLGWRKEWRRQYGGEIQNCDIWFAPGDSCGTWDAEPPKLSTTWDGMRMVMACMFDKDWLCTLQTYKCVRDSRLAATYHAEFESFYNSTQYEADDPTAPGAVALAAYNTLTAGGATTGVQIP